MTDIYHMTHIKNLASIINAKGLWSDNERIRQQLPQVNIAYQELKARRRQTTIQVAAGGFLGDYVPFYFAPRTPMLYTIVRGNVPNVAIDQQDIIYLVSSVERVIQEDCQWCFTDGHAVEQFSKFYTQHSDLRHLDWDVIQSRQWARTPEDPDRQRRKQAEFLVHQNFPLPWIRMIAVANNSTVQKVNQILAEYEHRPQVSITVQRNWYYDI